MCVCCRFEDERKAQKFLYRGTFGTQITGGWWKNLCQLSFRNPANTGLALWGGKLLALFECGHPHSLDPNDLTTNGPDYLNGTVTGGVPFSTGWRWLDQFAGSRIPLIVQRKLMTQSRRFQFLMGALAVTAYSLEFLPCNRHFCQPL